ncbi:unnamed protein product [Chilo suppressalis]|uniref:Arrestin C-terminal-like domain-containing protein n=1 Tax=Chilo suppressalis TaxID=168631 RepID=A0ABN8BHA6_CHISP|nr:unnamed protein product [Chilo suppressalis]
MAILCEINLDREPDHSFVPGEAVSGVIKYKLSENLTFKKITVSLMGEDLLTVDGTCQNSSSDISNENYVKINNLILEDEKGVTFAAGTYEIPFSMTLPYNIPKSFDYKNNKDGYCINYKIFYYIRVKFVRPGLMRHSQSFKKSINVSSGIVPTLPRVPVTYESKRKIEKLFSRGENSVALKVTVDNSVVETGGRVQIKCDVKNDTAFNIKQIKVKLVEELKIKATDISEDVYDDLYSISLNPSLKSRGDTDVIKAVLDVPKDAFTLQNSVLVSRNYFIYVTAVLPAFYKNAVLKVPIEVGENNIDAVIARDTPPSYWDAMNLCHENPTWLD